MPVEAAGSNAAKNEDQVNQKSRAEALGRFTVGFSIALTVLLFLVIVTEIVSGVLLAGPPASEDGGRTHSYYRDKPWAAEYFREFDASHRQQYRPYVIWRRAPFHGKYINVDKDGVRRTVNPNCSPDSFQIWTFGASTLWGVGAPDEQTIPSILSREYARSVGPVCVTNFGEGAWVSTQNVIQLELALKHAARLPNLVIFYDGLSDAIAIYTSRTDDVHFAFQKIGMLAETARNQHSDFRSQFGYLRQTATWRMIEKAMGQVAYWKNRTAPTPLSPQQIDQLAEMNVQNYRGNIKVVEALSQQYGFEFISFWEPMILAGNKPLCEAERQMLKSIEHSTPGLPELTRKTYDLMFAQPDPHVVNIADTFNGTDADFYMAVGHITPAGNQLIADRILSVLKKSGTEPASQH